MSGTIFRSALVRTVVVLLQLCGLLLAADLPGVWIDVPFVKQEKDGCGAASIAMVMQYWQRQQRQPAGSDSDAAQIQRELYSAKAHGIYASDMERYFKEKGFRTFTIRGEWEDLKQHLDKGRPLIVALMPAALKPAHERDAGAYTGDGTPLHYVVVAGLEPGQGLVLINDPAQRKLLKQDRSSFERGLERGRQLDAAGSSSTRRSLIPNALLLLLLLLSYAGLSLAQTGSSSDQLVDRARQLFAEQRWQEIVSLGESAKNPSADLDFYYGSALAQLGRWEDARQAFAAGARLQPGDKRFPLELAGVAFKQKQYTQATRFLRRALHLDPNDSYGNDFLGTVYFLQGNLEAALKYWNHVDKPQIAEVRSQPTPQVDAALLDRAFVFAPASRLRLADWLTTEVRIRGLEIFPRYQFDLLARPDGKVDVVFRNRERDGWGQSKLEKLFVLFRGLPFFTSLPRSITCGIRLSISYQCIAGTRRSGVFMRNSRVRSRRIRSSGTECSPTCEAKTGTFGIRFRDPRRCWGV